jgi:hypothetical protein
MTESKRRKRGDQNGSVCIVRLILRQQELVERHTERADLEGSSIEGVKERVMTCERVNWSTLIEEEREMTGTHIARASVEVIPDPKGNGFKNTALRRSERWEEEGSNNSLPEGEQVEILFVRDSRHKNEVIEDLCLRQLKTVSPVRNVSLR